MHPTSSNNSKIAIGAFIGGMATFAAMTLMGGCSGGAETVAVVNGEAISIQDFYRYMELKPDVRVVVDNGPATVPVDGTIGFQTLQDIIAQRLTYQLAKDRKIYPTDKEINDEVEFQKKRNPNFMVGLTSRGLTLDMIRKSLALDLIQEKMVTQGVKVDVDKYIKEHPSEFIEPERVELYWILVRDPKTQAAVDKRLNAGTSFTACALSLSEDPNLSRFQGRIVDQRSGGNPTIEGLDQGIRARVQAATEGAVTDWIRLNDGYAKFYVKKKFPKKAVVMDDVKREFLRRLLAKQRGQQSRDINKDILRKLQKSDIRINRSMYADPWKKAMDDFKTSSKIDDLTGTPTP